MFACDNLEFQFGNFEVGISYIRKVRVSHTAVLKMATTEMENVECISASYDIVDEDLQSLVSFSPYLMSALDPGKFNILQIANVKYVKFQTFVT